jgi:hypothetical protein
MRSRAEIEAEAQKVEGMLAHNAAQRAPRTPAEYDSRSRVVGECHRRLNELRDEWRAATR